MSCYKKDTGKIGLSDRRSERAIPFPVGEGKSKLIVFSVISFNNTPL